MSRFSKNAKIFIILLITFFIVLLISIFIKFIITDRVTLKTGTSSTSAINVTQPSSVSFKLKECINNIFYLMNNKNYEELYSLLSADFKKDKFNDNINTFTSFMQKYADKSYTPVYEKYTKFENTYLINIDFLEYSNSDDDILNPPKASKNDVLVINLLNDNNFTFSFLKYIGSKELNIGKENSLFSVILNKTVLYNTSSEFYFTVTNKSEKPISITKDNIFCNTNLTTRYYDQDINVEPNSTTDFCFTAGTGFSVKNALPDSIYFKDLTVGDSTYSFDIKTKYCFD